MERKKKNIVELTLMSASEFRAMPKCNFVVMADNVRSMHNIGSILRIADCFAISEVILAGISGAPPHPEIAKTALGAENTVAWRHVDNAVAEVKAFRERGWKICALEQAHGSIALENWEPERKDKYMLVVGNEVEGVNQEIVDLADICLEITQYGSKHSLNVSVSTGIAMWKIQNSLRAT